MGRGYHCRSWDGGYGRTTDSLEAIRDTAPLGTAMRGTDSAALASVCTEDRLAELDAANLPATTDGTKTKTDQLVFTNANKVDAAVLAVADFAAAVAQKLAAIILRRTMANIEADSNG